MSNLTPFEYAKYSEPPKEMVGCLFRNNTNTKNSGVGYFRIAVIYGLIYGCALFLFNVFFLELFGKDKTSFDVIKITLNFIVPFVIPSIVIYACLKNYRNKANYLGLKTGIKIGCAVMVVSSVFSSSLTYIYFNFIRQDSFDHYLSNLNQMYNNINFQEYKSTQYLMLLLSIPSGLLFGIVLSILPTYLLKSK